MTKSDLINALYSEYDITKQEAATIVNVFFNEISNALVVDLFPDLMDVWLPGKFNTIDIQRMIPI